MSTTEDNEIDAVKAELMNEQPLVNENSDNVPPETTDEVIKAAQDDILQLDVLVCGRCHNVYHFVEAFTEHKNSDECDGEKQVFKTSTNDTKPQVWAFLLWKAARTKDEGIQASPEWASNSWNLYQRWCKLTEDIRKTWIEAGKTLQNLTNTGNAKIDRNTLAKGSKSKAPMTPQQIQQQQQTLLELQKELEDDETEMMSTLGLIRGPTKPASGKTKKIILNETDPLALDKEDKGAKGGTNRVLRKSFKPKAEDEDTSEEEYVVEKIVAKRVNPKTKQPEYLLKWEGFPSDQNTWESVQNLGTCTKLVQEFEKNLARQKARKALEASKSSSKNILRLEDIVQNTTTTSTRPVRTSARKALDQVKEWVNMGNKRKYESDEESDVDDPKPKKQEQNGLENLFKKKIIGNSNTKSPVLVANSKGVVRVDPKQVPNLSSGVYILSSQSGLIKVDDPTAQKLTEAMKAEGKKFSDTLNPKVMINETEIRKIPAKNTQPKIGLLKREQSGIIKKESALSPSVKIIQKGSMNKLPVPLRLTSPKLSEQSNILTKLGSPKLSSAPKQILLGSKKTTTRPLPGPIPSPLKPPMLKPRVTIKTAPSKRGAQQIRLGLQKGKETVVMEKFSDDDFDAGLPDEFPKADDPISPPSPSRPLTLCPLTGEVLGKAEGEKTPPPQDECILPDIESDDGMMRVEMSPGGTIRQIITKPQQTKKQQQSLLQKKQQIQKKTPILTTGIENNESQEFISIESEDGIIYQITPEQQEMLLNNGTLTIDGRIVQEENETEAEQTEILIENGQIIQRIIRNNEENTSQDGSTILMQNDTSNEGHIILQNNDGNVYVTQEGDNDEGVLTLDSAVQEAVSQGADQDPASVVTSEFFQVKEDKEMTGQDDNQQMVAQIVQAEPPTPGGGPRKVVLLLPDGSLIHTEMDEEQYQALEFEK